jgi:peptide/nickel transport system substrate-binding protein
MEKKMKSKKFSRREFLIASATGIAGVLFSACATTTEAPGVDVEEVTTVDEVEPTPETTAIPTQAATATPVALAVSTFKESPLLADKVAAGALPPVDERLPKNPLVLSPVNVIGNYGGRARIQINWLGGLMEESQYGYSPVRWIDDGQGIAPGLLDEWSHNEDTSEWTLHMREGIKWSDGEPCTMKDTMFWWEDLTIAFNPDNPDPLPEFAFDANGELVKMTLMDDYTLRLTYGTPAPLTAKQLAMWVKGCIGPNRWITPSHYIKQFHPKYNSEYTDFTTLQEKILFRQNPECPTIDPWMCVRHDPSVNASWDRNPYYYAVDPEGNQLPYIDGWDETLVADTEARVTQVMQGGSDHNNWMFGQLSNYATFKQNEERGGYEAFLLDSGSGSGANYFFNHDNPDPKRRELYRTPKYRKALSHAIDRALIQEKAYYGTGIISTGTFSPKAYEFNWSEEGRAYWRKARDAHVAYDPELSMQLLDEIGMVDVDGDGWREYPDGTPFEHIIDITADIAGLYLTVLEIVKPQFEAIGVKVLLNSLPGAQYSTEWQAGQGSMHCQWEWADGPDFLVYPDPGTPVTFERWAPLCGQLYRHSGTPAEFTESDQSPWDRNPPRFNKNDPEYAGTVYEELHRRYRAAIVEPDTLKRTNLTYDLWDLHIEQGPFFIGTVANEGHVMIVGNNMENVPRPQQYKLGGWVYPWIMPNMAMTNPETYSFK